MGGSSLQVQLSNPKIIMDHSAIALIRQLGGALRSATQHLEYCNYGDNWERECAQETRLPKELGGALEAFTKFESEHSTEK